MEEKRVIEVDDYQHGLIINSLNDKRNELVELGRDTEFVDETLIEVMDAPTKKQRKNIEKRRDNDMIYCIESLGKTTEDMENADDEQPEGG